MGSMGGLAKGFTILILLIMIVGGILSATVATIGSTIGGIWAGALAGVLTGVAAGLWLRWTWLGFCGSVAGCAAGLSGGWTMQLLTGIGGIALGGLTALVVGITAFFLAALIASAFCDTCNRHLMKKDQPNSDV